jgi:hypothetical protein
VQWIPQENEDETIHQLTQRRVRMPEQDNEWLRLFERLVKERDEALQQLHTLHALAEQSMVEAEERTEDLARVERERDQALVQVASFRAQVSQGQAQSSEVTARLKALEKERDEVSAQFRTLREVNETTQLEVELLERRLAHTLKERDEAIAARTQTGSIVVSPDVLQTPDVTSELKVLKEALETKDERIVEMLDLLASKGERLQQLEATLKMLAEADEA